MAESGIKSNTMKKKLDEGEQELANSQSVSDLPAGGSPRPARYSGGSSRKSASHSSSKRKRTKAANRKGKSAGGMHQRGDKRVMR